MAESVTRSGTTIRHPDWSEVVSGNTNSGASDRRRTSPDNERISSETGAIDALLEGLSSQGASLSESFSIAPLQPDQEVDRRSVDRAEATLVEVKVEPGEEAVLLIEIDGVFEWRYSKSVDEIDPITGKRRGAGTESTRTFHLTRNSEAKTDDAPDRRGLLNWIAGGFIDRARVYVVKFMAEKTINFARKRLEESIRPGLVVMSGDDASSWIAKDRSTEIPQPADRPAKVLLCVHGTFSSTLGSFGALAATPWGKALLSQIYNEYDLVIGFDHRTLGETPEENARALNEAIGRQNFPQDTTLDVIAFSRGGLVARLLLERLLPESGFPMKPGKAIFVGCTNGGTALADRENWKTLLDLYTNIGIAAGKGLMVFDAGTASTIITESVKTLGSFLQAIVDKAITEEMVPGLAAMSPDSSLIEDLNGAAITTSEYDPNYFAMGSNFEPNATPTSATRTSLPEKLLKAIADFGADSLMKEDNDLVVDNEAMSQFGLRTEQIQATKFWEANAIIYHTNYFAQEQVVHTLQSWLLDEGLDRVLSSDVDKAMATPRPMPRDKQTEDRTALRRMGGNQSKSRARAPSKSTELKREAREELVSRSPGPSMLESMPPSRMAGKGAAKEAVQCFFGAEMPESAPLNSTVYLTVTVSREEIELAAGMTGKTDASSVSVGEPIEIEIHAKGNCEVLGETRVEIEVPNSGKPETLDFRIKGKAPGPAEIWVDARQGARRLTRMVIQPVFINDGVLRASSVIDTFKTDPPMVQLRIFENANSRTDPFSLRFVMESRDLNIQISEETQRFHEPREPYIRSLYEKLEGEWGKNLTDFDLFMRGLRTIGGELYNTLVPEPVRKKIWEHRLEIGSIEIISHEPFIPWEVLHVVEPEKKLPPGGNMFLAELGVVRWVNNLGWPPARLKVRNNMARHVIPNYENQNLRLTGAQDERNLLQFLFDSKEVHAKSDAIIELISSEGKFDLLHFACHGHASEDQIWDSSLLMADARDVLNVLDVSQYADLSNGDGTKPIVFLNACQVGKVGRTLAGTGGMAEAFVKAGAGMFVGALWSVGDKTALSFAESFYKDLMNGATVVQATREARKAAKDAREPTWLAYTVYGHPYARVEVGE